MWKEKKETQICLPCYKIFIETRLLVAKGLSVKWTAHYTFSIQILQFSN